MQRADTQSAERHYKAALVIDPDNFAADFDLGNLLLKNDPNGAITHYQSAARKQPDSVEVQINWGIAQIKLKNLAEAYPHFHTAELMDPYSYDAHYNLGQLFFSAGKLPQARAEFELALQPRPNDPAAMRGLSASR